MRILVDDDDPVFSRLLEERLTGLAFKVQVTRDTLQAWHILRRDPPDLVLLDMQMPGGSGLAVLRRIKSNLQTRGVPVIVITAAQDESTLQQIHVARPEGLLRKPIVFEELALEINRLLAARALSRPERRLAQKGPG